MQYGISIFIGDQSNTENSEIYNFENFEQLAKQFSTCRKGKKHSAYWTRGICKGKRCDDNIENSNLLILDADAGADGGSAPNPADLHDILISAGLNHFIYTSHSHKPGVNKFRVVLPLNRFIVKKELRRIVVDMCDLLDGWNVGIKRVKEMTTWSQPWFAPSRDDPDDGIFEFYEFSKGKDVYVKESKAEDEKKEEEAAEEESDGSSVSDEEFISALASGEGIHPAILSQSTQWAKEGASKEFNYRQMVFYLKMSALQSVRPERFDELVGEDGKATKELRRIIDGAYNSKEIDLDNIKIREPKDSYAPPPMPHGLLGKMVKETKEFMLYEDDTIAFVSAMFIVASICGRKFNVDIHNEKGMAKPTALNMYFTLAAETGVGKSEIEDAVENCYFQFAGSNGVVKDFFYKGRVSGPRALYRIYEGQRSIGIIANEAGIEGQSTLGDHTGLRSAWLNLYGQGAWKKWTGASELSDSDNSIKSVRAVAISRVSESTPVELAKYYRLGNSVENGLIPRENIFVIKKLNVNPNLDIRLSYSDDIISRMVDLVNTCHSDVAEDTLFKPFIITVKDKELLDEIVETQKYYRGQQNSADTIHERAMSGRMFVKMLRYAGLITAVNKTKDDPMALVLERREWEWAKAVVEDEFEKINDVVALTSGSDLMDTLIDHICIKVGLILNDEIRNQELRLEPSERKRGIIPTSKLKKACRTNPMFKELEGDPKYSAQYRSGWDKVMHYLEKINYIEMIEKNPYRKGSAVKVKDGLVAHLENMS